MVLKPFSNVDFFSPLIAEMTQPKPVARPTAGAALALWQGIRKSISTAHKEWRPRPRKEHPLGTIVFDAVSLKQFFMFCTKSLVGMLPK